jgi:hypothetical protein
MTLGIVHALHICYCYMAQNLVDSMFHFSCGFMATAASKCPIKLTRLTMVKALLLCCCKLLLSTKQSQAAYGLTLTRSTVTSALLLPNTKEV